MFGKPSILSLFTNIFNKFNKYEHSCKILYLHAISYLLYVYPQRYQKVLSGVIAITFVCLIHQQSFSYVGTGSWIEPVLS